MNDQDNLSPNPISQTETNSPVDATSQIAALTKLQLESATANQPNPTSPDQSVVMTPHETDSRVPAGVAIPTVEPQQPTATPVQTENDARVIDSDTQTIPTSVKLIDFLSHGLDPKDPIKSLNAALSEIAGLGPIADEYKKLTLTAGGQRLAQILLQIGAKRQLNSQMVTSENQIPEQKAA